MMHTFIGNLTAAPTTHKTPDGRVSIHLRLACSERYRDSRSGEWKSKEPTFWDAYAWGASSTRTRESRTRRKPARLPRDRRRRPRSTPLTKRKQPRSTPRSTPLRHPKNAPEKRLTGGCGNACAPHIPRPATPNSLASCTRPANQVNELSAVRSA